MSYGVHILPRAKKQLSKLNSPHFASIEDKIFALGANPRPAGCKKLRGRDGWRIRVGDYRILYEISDSTKLVTIMKIGHRSEIYA